MVFQVLMVKMDKMLKILITLQQLEPSIAQLDPLVLLVLLVDLVCVECEVEKVLLDIQVPMVFPAYLVIWDLPVLQVITEKLVHLVRRELTLKKVSHVKVIQEHLEKLEIKGNKVNKDQQEPQVNPAQWDLPVHQASKAQPGLMENLDLMALKVPQEKMLSIVHVPIAMEAEVVVDVMVVAMEVTTQLAVIVKLKYSDIFKYFSL